MGDGDEQFWKIVKLMRGGGGIGIGGLLNVDLFGVGSVEVSQAERRCDWKVNG